MTGPEPFGRRKQKTKRTEYIKKSLPRTPSGRTCAICGKDPRPNRFFCTTCHGSVSAAYPVAEEY